MALSFYYSSGDYAANYKNETSKSLGGLVTDVQVPNNRLRNIFAPLSQNMVGRGSVDYRAIYLKTDVALTNLHLYTLVPIITNTLDPANLSPAPNAGDKYVVPANAVGLWATYDGKIAYYTGTSWVFYLPDFATYDYGAMSPADATINSVLYAKQFIPFTDSCFRQPNNVIFTNADTAANKILLIASMAINDLLALWIRRTVKPFKLTSKELPLNTTVDGFDPNITVYDPAKSVNFNQLVDLVFDFTTA